MKTLIRFAIVPALLVAGLGMLLHAQDATPERAVGKVLLLKTGHAMEGDIEKIGGQFCVRRGKSEVWLATDKAVRLCADWDDAFAFARTLVKADDALGHIQLARWCHLHRMTDRALIVAQKAVELQPDNSDAKQLVSQLERLLREPAPKTLPLAPVAPRVDIEPAPTVDVSFETLVHFTTRVQPILMNTCANCHTSGYTGKFKLERVSESGKKPATQRNLASVLDQIDLDRPAISPVLVRAITPHGGGLVPPLKDRSTAPFQATLQWIELTIAKNPQLKDYQAARKPAPAPMPGESNFAVPPGSEPKIPAPAPMPVSRGVAQSETQKQEPTAPRVWSPRDEFDADLFNRWAHPKK